MDNGNQVTLQDVFEIVTYIKDNAAMQKSVDERFKGVDERFKGMDERFEGVDKKIEGLRSELKGDIALLRSDMERGFEGLRAELRDIRSELEDIKRHLDALEVRAREDADASAEDYLKLRERVDWLETKVKELEMARS